MKTRLFLLGFGRSGTSVTRHVLSSLPSSKILHEVNLYTKVLRASNIQEYKMGIANKLVPNRRPSLTAGMVGSKFKQRFTLLHKPSQNKLDWILSAEKALFDNRYDFIGNKFACQGSSLPDLVHLEQLGLDFTYVYIYRDVRDVCSSRYKRWGHSPVKTSKKWSRNIHNWRRLQQQLNGPSMEIKFERLVKAPVGMGREIAKFLSVDYNDVSHAISVCVDRQTSNIGEHKKYKINLRDLHPEAINTALELGYKQ